MAQALPPLAELLAAAEANRADLRALQDIVLAAQARVAQARADAWPNLRIGVFAGREAGMDTLVGAGVSIPLPFIQRNQGAIAEAQATALRVAAERDGARASVVRQVVTAYERHRAGLTSLTSLRERVIGTTEESLELLRQAFEAGKTGWTDVLVMRRALFDAQRALVETSAQVRRARVRIDIAAGRTPLPARAAAE
jgi:cobalt-zinc-cadmium efflux system outer membrane protein